MTRRKTYEEFIDKHGRQYEFPAEFNGNDMFVKKCYFAAAARALGVPGCTYVEGFTHAWVVDSAGRVIECTGPPDLHAHMLQTDPDFYFGVPYDTDWLREVVDRRGGFLSEDGDQVVTLPSLEYLVFNPLGWRAFAAGVKREGGSR